MTKSLMTLALAGLLSTLLGCGGDSEEELPEVDCNTGAVPKYSELKTTVFAKCTVCHDSAKSGQARVEAPNDVNYDMYSTAKAKAKKAAAEVNEGAMPPKPFPALTDAEAQQLYKWALCGTPE
jgi:uncharacterized membrane protein